jgi:hypothetical protein
MIANFATTPPRRVDAMSRQDEAPTCAVCRQDVTPGVPGVIPAVEVLHEQDFGGALVEPREGKVIFFHEAHMPAETGGYGIN